MDKAGVFFIKAKEIIKNNIDFMDNVDLYYSAKLIDSIVDCIDEGDQVDLPIVERYDDKWKVIDLKYGGYFDPYYACIEFPNGRHLPLPLLAGRNRYDEIEDRPGVQGEIIKLALKYCLPLRKLALRVLREVYSESTFSTDFKRPETFGMSPEEIIKYKREKFLEENPLSIDLQQKLTRIKRAIVSLLRREDRSAIINTYDLPGGYWEFYTHDYDYEKEKFKNHHIIDALEIKYNQYTKSWYTIGLDSLLEEKRVAIIKAIQYMEDIIPWPDELRFTFCKRKSSIISRPNKYLIIDTADYNDKTFAVHAAIFDNGVEVVSFSGLTDPNHDYKRNWGRNMLLGHKSDADISKFHSHQELRIAFSEFWNEHTKDEDLTIVHGIKTENITIFHEMYKNNEIDKYIPSFSFMSIATFSVYSLGQYMSSEMWGKKEIKVAVDT